jgi:hypothetical protein
VDTTGPTGFPKPLRYVPYTELDGRPNVVVDGSPTEGTVLTLTHWPGHPQSEGLGADLSAQMALAYAASGRHLHGAAEAVSNNHFDQDGLVGVFALAAPEAALPRRRLLEDLAGAWDFATFTDRRAARISMAVAAWADPARSPLSLSGDPAERCAQLYRELMGRLGELCDHTERFSGQWEEEDASLAASEELVVSGVVGISEFPTEDLAVVDVPVGLEPAGGHRFAHDWVSGVHPMAVHNATRRGALLIRQGDSYAFRYRYETWVQYHSRPVRARRDLAPLAEELTSLEPDAVAWSYEGSASLSPRLHPGGPSGIAPDRLVERVRSFLLTAPPDWDPFHRVG